MDAFGDSTYTSLVVKGCLFTNTWAMSSGGALFIKDINSVEISNSTFQGLNAWFAYGGAIYVDSGDVSVQVCDSIQILKCI